MPLDEGWLLVLVKRGRRPLLTEDLVSDVVLADEVAEEFLVDARGVDDLQANVSHASKESLLKTLRKLRPTAVSQNVHPSSIAFSSTGSACSSVKLLPKPWLSPMAPNPGTGTLTSPKGRVSVMIPDLECINKVE
jgi:hypothetical protein